MNNGYCVYCVAGASILTSVLTLLWCLCSMCGYCHILSAKSIHNDTTDMHV